MQFPKHIQQAVDLGLLQAEGDQIIGVAAEEAETVLGIARLMEKIQPTTKTDTEETYDQEAIVLCRVLTSPSGLARELWSELRIAVGVGHGLRGRRRAVCGPCRRVRCPARHRWRLPPVDAPSA